jgi:hypothetical protein
MELDGSSLLGLVVLAQCSSDVLVPERRMCLLPRRAGLRLWSRLEPGVDDRVEAAAFPVAESDSPVLACPFEDLERCLVGRLHFLREQLLTAVGEIEPEGYEHARQSKPSCSAAGKKLHKTWTGF